MMEVESVSKEFGSVMLESGKTIALAESCTGGAVSHIITNTPGSSEYYLGGVITYSDESKMKLLGVKKESLENYGAVSAETVKEMAEGVRKIFDSDIGLAISGIAGPGGGTVEKPVGLVYFGLDDGSDIHSFEHRLTGSRLAIKRESCLIAMELIIERL
jgi:nicotinamide-nucleotide amidase